MSKDDVITSGLQCTGTWFLPEEPDIQLYGNLSLVPGEDAKLEVIGSFRRVNAEQHQNFICGTATDGTFITLYRPFKFYESVGGGGQNVTIFRPEIVLLGAHFFSEEDLCFDHIYFGFHNLDEWLDVSGFKILHPVAPGRAEIAYTQPDSIHLYSCEEYEVKIFFGYRGPNLKHVQKDVTINQSASVVVSRRQDKSLKSYWRVHNHVVNFLHLATRSSVYTTKITALLKERVNVPVDVGSQGVLVHIVHIFVAVDALPPAVALYPHQMLFVYADIRDRVNTVVSAWFQTSEALRHACNVLFQTLYGRKLYLDNKLIGVTQAAEEIHRRLFGGTYEEIESYRSGLYQLFVQAIPKTVPKAYRASLTKRLQYLNEYSLRKRIRDLIKACPKQVIDEMLGQRKDVDNFIELVVDLRNSLAHHNEASVGLSNITSPAFWAIQALEVILEMILLNKICFSKDEIRELLKRNYRCSQEIGEIRRNVVKGDDSDAKIC